MTRGCALNGEIVSAQREGKISHRTLYCPLTRGLSESDALHRKHKEKSQSLHLGAVEIIVSHATSQHLFCKTTQGINYKIRTLIENYLLGYAK